MKYSLIFLLIFISPVCNAVDITLVDYGIYKETKETTRRPLNSDEQSILEEAIIINSKHIEETNIISNQNNILWGFRYKVSGKSIGNVIKVKHIYKHPPLISADGKVITEDILYHNRKNGGTYNHQWYIGKTSSIYNGKWVFELHHNDRLIIKKEFIVKPHANKSVK